MRSHLQNGGAFDVYLRILVSFVADRSPAVLRDAHFPSCASVSFEGLCTSSLSESWKASVLESCVLCFRLHEWVVVV